MKRYKLMNGEGWDDFTEGEIYESTYRNKYGLEVEYLATGGLNKGDWEEVIETDEEVVKKLVSEYWFSEEDAREFLSKFNKMKKVFNIEITVYQAVDLINYFK